MPWFSHISACAALPPGMHFQVSDVQHHGHSRPFDSCPQKSYQADMWNSHMQEQHVLGTGGALAWPRLPCAADNNKPTLQPQQLLQTHQVAVCPLLQSLCCVGRDRMLLDICHIEMLPKAGL